MCFARSLSEGIEFPCFCVRFKLPVPSLGIELGKPLAERSEFLGRQSLNLTLEIIDFAHIQPPMHSTDYRSVATAG